MITLTTGSDVLIKLEFGNIALTDIMQLEIDYYTDPAQKVTLTKDNGILMLDGYMCAKLESTQTANFKGVLRADIRIAWSNSVFSDQLQNETIKQTLNIRYV